MTYHICLKTIIGKLKINKTGVVSFSGQNFVYKFYAEFSDIELLGASNYNFDDVVRLEDEYGRC